MEPNELRKTLSELGLQQNDFADMTGVTPRAVTLWLAGERGIPGAVDAYLRVFRQLPPDLQKIEIDRFKMKENIMRTGMYGITFGSVAGWGEGVLVFDEGRVFGIDAGRARYDGIYSADPKTGLINLKVRVTFPPNGLAVFGESRPYEWSFEIIATIDPTKPKGAMSFPSPFGPIIKAEYEFLRPLAEAA